jgi:EAL domain-containing protein (putative c-di-GMP-specific phosphodiesterase class I)
MTAYADDETLERAKVTEPYGYLVKPFKPHDLKTTIEVALQKYRTDAAIQIGYMTRLHDVEQKLNYLNSLLEQETTAHLYSHNATADSLALEVELRQALNQHEFYLVYQPRVDLASGRIVGAEALLRWQHTHRGTISPTEFIPLAELTGLIDPLGKWVLQTACEQLKAWQQSGLADLSIAVNLSGYQLKQPHLPQQIEQILQQTSLDPHLVELELTESTLIEDIDLALRQLQGLKEMGLQIAMDDFGTGYSCLSHLHRLPFDTLKLDRSFIHNIDCNSKNSAIAVAIISMSQRMNLRVVAEGVETSAELAFLRDHACDEMQGFLFSQALTAAEFEALVRSNKRL